MALLEDAIRFFYIHKALAVAAAAGIAIAGNLAWELFAHLWLIGAGMSGAASWPACGMVSTLFHLGGWAL